MTVQAITQPVAAGHPGGSQSRVKWRIVPCCSKDIERCGIREQAAPAFTLLEQMQGAIRETAADIFGDQRLRHDTVEIPQVRRYWGTGCCWIPS